jgi:hypothetical protein
MDALGIRQPIVFTSSAQTAPVPVPQKPAAPLPVIGGGSAASEEQDVEQQRFEAVQRVSEQVADFFVVSDKTFTIFKDVSGQYVTRFTSLRDGKVTYIPEPNLFRLGGQNDRPTVNIKA